MTRLTEAQKSIVDWVSGFDAYWEKMSWQAAKFLDHLAANASRPGEERGIKKLAIYFNAERSDSIPDQQIPAKIRTLNKKLEKLFQLEEARHFKEEFRVVHEEHSHGYRLDFMSRSLDACKLFWQPHLGTKHPTLIGYGLALFERRGKTPNLEFVRKVRVNAAHRLTDKKRTPSWTFVTLGEVKCSIAVLRYLSKMQTDVDIDGFRHETTRNDVLARGGATHQSFVLVGSARSNGALAAYEGDLSKFPIGLDGHPGTDDDTCHVVVSRTPGIRDASTCCTTIASINGLALEQFGTDLTSSDELRRLLSFSIPNSDSTPLDELRRGRNSFSLLYKVPLRDNGASVGSVSLLDAWFADPKEAVTKTM